MCHTWSIWGTNLGATHGRSTWVEPPPFFLQNPVVIFHMDDGHLNLTVDNGDRGSPASELPEARRGPGSKEASEERTPRILTGGASRDARRQEKR